jgi:hypothetical protein
MINSSFNTKDKIMVNTSEITNNNKNNTDKSNNVINKKNKQNNIFSNFNEKIKSKRDDLKSVISWEINTNKNLQSLSRIKKYLKNPEMQIPENNKSNSYDIFKENKYRKKVYFDFSVFDIFCKFCFICCKLKNKKYNLYKQSFKSINDQLNVYFYLKLIQEIEIIKTLVFTIDQIGLINFISKPMICNELNSTSKNREIGIEEMFYRELDIDNVIYNYKNILLEKNLNDVDHKLITILHYELDNLIDK